MCILSSTLGDIHIDLALKANAIVAFESYKRGLKWRFSHISKLSDLYKTHSPP